jgi:RNA polymerase sigma factor (sigma-70 family)
MHAHASETPNSWNEDFNELLAFEGMLRFRVKGWIANRADVDEILQETYTRMLERSRKGSKPVEFVRAFSLTTARNAILDLNRHREIFEEVEFNEESINVFGSSAEEEISAQQEIDQFIELLRALTDRRRQVLVLRKVYDYPQKKIAALLGISENTVEQHIQKAIEQLLSVLGENASIASLPFPVRTRRSVLAIRRRVGKRGRKSTAP